MHAVCHCPVQVPRFLACQQITLVLCYLASAPHALAHLAQYAAIPYKPHYVVRPSVCLSVSYELLTEK